MTSLLDGGFVSLSVPTSTLIENYFRWFFVVACACLVFKPTNLFLHSAMQRSLSVNSN
jgi:hypothetical protein